MAHLVRDHGKTTASLTGTGGLDGGIECQQVGLVRDGTDDVEDVANLGALLIQLVNICHRMIDLGGHLLDQRHSLGHLLLTI